MVHLGDPTRKVDVLPDPVVVDMDTMPEDVSDERDRQVFHQPDQQEMARTTRSFSTTRIIENLNEAYWANFEHQLLSVELSEAQTSALVARCRRKRRHRQFGVDGGFCRGADHRSGRSALSREHRPWPPHVRERLRKPVGEVMGFYAGIVMPKYKYNGRIRFLGNARRLHKKIKPLVTNKNLFVEFTAVVLSRSGDPGGDQFQETGRPGPAAPGELSKAVAFGQQDDVVLGLLKRDKQESLDRKIMGTAVTNLTRMDFPRTYGAWNWIA